VIRLAILVALLLAACTGGQAVDPNNRTVRYWHDDAHGVSCWTAWSSSITCLPDTQVRQP
jgi:outer membrane biogenesis lipoprotein LolB